MTYKKKINIKNNPLQNARAMSKLTSKEWKDWMKDRLHGMDEFPMSRDSLEGQSWSMFIDIAERVDESVRNRIFEGLKECLRDAHVSLKKPNELWDSEVLDDLLLFAGCFGHEFGNFKDDHELIIQFLEATTPSPTPPGSYDTDLYGRALQTLLNMEAVLPMEFWTQNLEHSPQQYAGICFSGAMNNSPFEALMLLPNIDWTDKDARGIMLNTIAFGFIEEHGKNATLMSALMSAKEQLPKEAQGVIDQAIEMRSKA